MSKRRLNIRWEEFMKARDALMAFELTKRGGGNGREEGSEANNGKEARQIEALCQMRREALCNHMEGGSLL